MLIYRNICCFIFIITLVFSCGSVADKSASESSLKALNNLVTSRSVEIEADWAFPLMTQGITSVANSGLLLPGSNANRIDLMGNSNYLRIKGDSIDVSLPYFGERQIGGRYANSDVGIKVKGEAMEYQVEKEEKKNAYRIKFSLKDEIETLQFYVTLFPSGKASINVNSTHRSSIRYDGDAVPLLDD
ncbi:DUF4251 domain-containing protein [Muriicola soli]|uniref:DUF4251 domain-containing protein n=1 Tax=Muriicola soli TaxID=2507538 RepID=A0A411E934_9FLAO|nr:DUF4251 domain-containing protein [Muriicola soli]QBA64148.1 DUF4251 domain-containing protein [Muriicola soli]